MTGFEVQGMTCGRCLDVITRTIKSGDRSAHVMIDLQTRRVRIESRLAPKAFAAAIRAAGYTPVP